MKYGSKYASRKHSVVTRVIENNPAFLSAKASLNLLFSRPKNAHKINLPLLIISGMQRSGTHLIHNLFKNHQHVLSYYNELQIGKPNKYHWPDLRNICDVNDRFKALIPRNMVKHLLEINHRDNFIFDFSYFRKTFIQFEKKNTDFNQRTTLDHFFSAYFAAYLNCNHSNFFDQYKYIVAPIPGLTIIKKSIEGFFKDYPDGKIFVSIREPYLWWNSARKHSERQKRFGLERYQNTIDNTIWACREYPYKIFALSFDHLIKNSEESIRSILACADMEFSPVSSYPSNFPHYAIDNSTFGAKKAKTILKEKVKRELNIPEQEMQHIQKNIFPKYEDLINNHAINLK